jgi:magnesium-transporting ATPase (P-type)
LKDAGIKVWMLTGDKAITAKMIGIQCGLLNINSTLIRLKELSNLDEVKNEIQKASLTIGDIKNF